MVENFGKNDKANLRLGFHKLGLIDNVGGRSSNVL